MALDINVTADVKRAKRFYSELNKSAANRATANALNVMARTVRKVSVDHVSKFRRIGKRKVGTMVKLVKRASAWDQVAIIRAFGGPVSLKEYSPKQTRRGVTVNVEGKRKLIPDAFIGPNGHVFIRLGRKAKATKGRYAGRQRQRIQKRMGPSITTGFLKEIVRLEQKRVIRRDWKRVLNEKMEDQLTKLRAKHALR